MVSILVMARRHGLQEPRKLRPWVGFGPKYIFAVYRHTYHGRTWTLALMAVDINVPAHVVDVLVDLHLDLAMNLVYHEDEESRDLMPVELDTDHALRGLEHEIGTDSFELHVIRLQRVGGDCSEGLRRQRRYRPSHSL